MTYLLEYLKFFSIYIGLSDKLLLNTYLYPQAIRKRYSNRHIINKHAATLARVDIHRQDDGVGYVEAWDQHHDIVVNIYYGTFLYIWIFI
jgi:hypothetical protein